MRKVKNVSLTIFLILAVLLSSVNIVNAVSPSATFELTTENTNVKVGDEVTVTLKIGTLNGLSNVGKFNALKSFDSTVFEYLGAEGLNGWEVKGDATNLLLVRGEYAPSGNIAKLKFKVLKEVENARIQLSELDATGSDGNVYYEDENVNAPYVDFKVTTKEPVKDPEEDPTEDPKDDPTKDPVDDPTKDPTEDPKKDPVKEPTGDSQKPSGSNTGVKNDKTTATTGKIPQTGEPYMLIVFGVLGLVLTGISYARYQIQIRKMK